ncbi:MAG: hypothetical protein HC809_08615 [Gammaproteobacteria bacterium]|nr:hypothetical protein [Gammaproteobacteria bacterium]
MNTLKGFPRSHLVLAAFVAMPLTSFLIASPTPEGEDRFTTELVLAEIADGTDLQAIDAPTPSDAPISAIREHHEVVRAGDSLARIFQRASIPPRELAAVLESGRQLPG